MTSVRQRFDSWTVSPVVVALAIVAVIAGVVVFAIGSKQQQARTIPPVRSVTICTAPPTTESPCAGPGSTRATFGRTQATDLANAVNALPNRANVGGCSRGGTPVYQLTFTTSGRPVVATFQANGCPTVVSFTAVGQAWGARRYDDSSVVLSLVTSDLRSVGSHS